LSTSPSGTGAPGTTTPRGPRTHPGISTTEAARKAPATEVSRGAGTRPEVALTFHGAGDPALASAILDVAKTHQAKLTVMGVGIWLAANRSTANRILSDGHELGNHTWTHPVLRNLDRTHAYAEIERCRQELERLTGSPGRWFRQSGSQHSTPLIRELAGQAGYRVCLSYDIDSLDWTDPGPSAVVRNVRAATAGSIISMHLGHPGTLSALPRILRELGDRSLHAVTVGRLLAP
jgi:peptidoglycan/xylan/chitin deacetylase (PgdA/CDA1 family)